MTEILIGIGLVIFLGGLFYFLARHHDRQIENVDETVYKEAKTRGLEIKKMVYPSFQEWQKSPFDKEIEIGTFGFEGIPYSREYYRILKCLDIESNLGMTI